MKMKMDKQILKVLNEINYQLDFLIRLRFKSQDEEDYDKMLSIANEHFEEMLK